MSKTTILVGAGATLAEAIRQGSTPFPPLDRTFFAAIAKSRPADFRAIHGYMRSHYSVDIAAPDGGGLESVMSVIYTDIWHPDQAGAAAGPFRALIRSLNAELAATTASMGTDASALLYRTVRKEMGAGVPLDEIAFITFNYDLRIELTLEAMGSDGYHTQDGVALNFPYCYHLPPAVVSAPTAGVQDLFAPGDPRCTGVAVYKLHGSLNWYSRHLSRTPSPSALLRKTRAVEITRRKRPGATMTVGGKRRMYAFPVVVPPILNKAAVLPTGFHGVWRDAEADLARSEHLIVFGYSCPALDFEAANLIARSLRGKAALKKVSIIDPNPAVIARYAELTRASHVDYHRDAQSYLT